MKFSQLHPVALTLLLLLLLLPQFSLPHSAIQHPMAAAHAIGSSPSTSKESPPSEAIIHVYVNSVAYEMRLPLAEVIGCGS